MGIEGRQINKSAIRNFAIEARKILIRSAITEAGFYGITKDKIKYPVQRGRDFEVYETLTGTEKRIFDSDVKRRAALVEAIHLKGFDEVMEETAYTWFNRLIAIRFMEVNNYLPFRMRVLSSDSGSFTPDIVSRSLEVNLNLTEKEMAAVQKAKDENSYDEAFRLLFIKACNVLNEILPGLFEKTDDYMELLLKLPYTSDGVVRMLVDTIPESNFNINEGGQVEIIGWLYQYYNTEPKAKAFAKKGKITKEEIPAVTQLFTPDWIVRYMVENSLGRLWVEHLLANGDSRSEQEIANDFGWKYYLPEAEQEPEVQAQLVQIRAERKNLTPEDILCIDPCQGSGHILVYFFDVLMQIYREDGYSERDAARSILEYNLYGLDIDDRAYQLSYFAVLMKARQYDRMILKKHIRPHVYSIQESNNINRNQLKYFGADMSETERKNAVNQLTVLLDTFKDAKEYGSILNVPPCNWDFLCKFVKNDAGQFEFEALGIDKTQEKILLLLNIGQVMSQKYHVVTTNPPYLALSSASLLLYKYMKKEYPEGRNDLYSVFIEKCNRFTVTCGYYAMITQHTWMFLSRSEELRKKILQNCIINMAHLGTRAFEEIGGEVVQTTSFVILKTKGNSYAGTFIRLVDYMSQEKKQEQFCKGHNRYKATKKDFEKVPGNMIIYWQDDQFLDNFNNKLVGDMINSRVGLDTGDNEKYIRLWHEVDYSKILFNASSKEDVSNGKKWVPHTKGGPYRKWYGNLDCVIAFDEFNYSSLLESGNHLPSRQFYFKEGITWSRISTSNFAVRYSPNGIVFNSACPTAFADNEMLRYALGLLNSVIVKVYVMALSPTMNFQAGDIDKVPFIITDKAKERVLELVDENINIAKTEWDSYENSWEFKEHPLIPKDQYASIPLTQLYDKWLTDSQKRFAKLKENEESLNSVFIELYRLNGVTELVAEEDITLRTANPKTDMCSLLQYAVGCMFGRYSLDVDGLAYAGGNWKEAYATKYKTFMPDEDAIIPITDEEYLKDDIVARFVDFIRIVYGEETLEENLKFIADALGNKGDTSRAVIRNYFLNDFYKDHCNTYSVTGSGKRPIYWLFDSGKQNGFKALIYIHRYTPDTVGLIRSVYLHNVQAAIQNSLQNSEYIISTTTSATERARETKKRDKYVKQLNELRPYYQALSHVALQRIPMDLDDGVKKNYQLFQGVEISTEGKKKQKIDLLAKL